mgnify:CR=1 FL=1
MKAFHITMPDQSLRQAIQDKIDNLNKPKGSLGRLEELAMQLCLIQQSLEPSLAHPCHLLLGADHGIARIEQALDDRAEIGGTLAVVVEPGAAIDVDHHGITGLLLFGQVDVAGVVRLVVASIVHVFPLLAGL